MKSVMTRSSSTVNRFPSSGLTVDDIDVFEINEAFASQVSSGAKFVDLFLTAGRCFVSAG